MTPGAEDGRLPLLRHLVQLLCVLLPLGRRVGVAQLLARRDDIHAVLEDTLELGVGLLQVAHRRVGDDVGFGRLEDGVDVVADLDAELSSSP